MAEICIRKNQSRAHPLEYPPNPVPEGKNWLLAIAIDEFYKRPTD